MLYENRYFQNKHFHIDTIARKWEITDLLAKFMLQFPYLYREC